METAAAAVLDKKDAGGWKVDMHHPVDCGSLCRPRGGQHCWAINIKGADSCLLTSEREKTTTFWKTRIKKSVSR